MPSSPVRLSAPASSASVGSMSQKAKGRSLAPPRAILPGQRTSIGSRMPPSCTDQLDAPQRPAAVEELRIDAAFLVRTIVAAEENDRLVVDTQLAEPRQQAAYVGIHTADHGGFALLRRGPRLAGVGTQIGHSMPLGFDSSLAWGIVNAR